jgi:hypothetical protein
MDWRRRLRTLARCLITFPNYPVQSDSPRSEGISDMAFRTRVKGVASRIGSATTAMFTSYSRSADFQVRKTTPVTASERARQPWDTRSIAAPISSPWLRRTAQCGRGAVTAPKNEWLGHWWRHNDGDLFGPGSSDVALAAGSA